MKLTEQQLAQMFQNSKNTVVEHESNDLYATVDASDKRLNDVEKIADNSTLSASYQIINQLQNWSQAVGNDIELSLKPRFTTTVLSWFKPTIATAAIVTAVYFVTPNMTAELDKNIQQQSDVIISSSSFENGNNNNDVIKNVSFDKSSNGINGDVILKTNFG